MVDWESFYRSFREPDYVPGFEILERLGGGAFGEVYRARKTSIGKSYAIKFLKVEDDRSQEIIERELGHARLFAAIDHANLVAIEDLGAVDGVPYVVMGYAGEDTLARRLSRGGLEASTAFEYFVQVCRGVLALHERNLVHFDLKPSNVFLRGDVARVGDYGLAKLLADGRQTLSIGRGTPHYMAPEVLRGRADQRADIYSLGVILFETFAGRVPYEGDSGLQALFDDEARAIEFPDAFPESLREIVVRCLSVDPAKRPSSVSELLQLLGQTGRAGEAVSLPFEQGTLLVGAQPRGASSTASTGSGRPTPVDDVVEWEALGAGSDEGAGDEGRGPDAEEQGSEVERFVPAPTPAAASATPSGSFATGAAFARAPRGRPGVPVPPRFDGGPIGALAAVGALALEMFLALLHGPVRATVDVGSRGVGSAVRAGMGIVRWTLISYALGGAAGGLLLLVLFD